jgi:HEPN domain-containing protein
MIKEQQFLAQKAQDSLRAAKLLEAEGDYDRTERLESEDAKLVIQRAEEFLELLTYL